jgi:DNA (cytosine-5)-methyltransferase 1
VTTVGALFAGYGGLELGLRQVMDVDLAWYSENDPAAARIMAHHHPDTCNIGDITQADWTRVEPVDVLTGGFPCQDVSTAGKRLGLRPGTRSGLWSYMAYAVWRLRPSLVIIENVRGLLSADATGDLEHCSWCMGDADAGVLRACGAVLADLADIGYDVRWLGLRAADIGAPHGRFRVFLTATPADTDGAGLEGAESARRQYLSSGSTPAYTDSAGCGSLRRQQPDGRHPDGRHNTNPNGNGPEPASFGEYTAAVRRWEHAIGRRAPDPTQPGRSGPRLSPRFVEWMMGLSDGYVTAVPSLTRNAQLKALGNGVVPQQAAAAIAELLAA